jgi:ribosomal protein S18 acetylase RimI-like enzyme
MPIRPATTDDTDFLVDMLLEAINWTPDRSIDRLEATTDPELAHYVEDWMRPTDFGFIAVDDAGDRIGACWLRYFDSTDPSYGYVADDVPELNISVVADVRGQGIGRSLVRASVAEARKRGIARISLSVEHGNRAVDLYKSEGFTYYETTDGSDTYTLTL